MPRQNRCDPFGKLHAVPDRGLLMGNRGCLHDEAGRIVRTHRGTSGWISCTTRWPGVRRSLMAPGRYTELFFLDEATALAAGHRPCSECRRAAARDFKQRWHQVHGRDGSATDIGRRIVAERQADPAPRPAAVPDGAMLGSADAAWLRWHDRWYRWSFAGYRPEAPPPDAPLLTAPSIIAVLAVGYHPIVHPSASGVDGGAAAP